MTQHEEEQMESTPGEAFEREMSLQAIRQLVDEQAEDEALWATNLDGTVSISEAYLQQELRRLHALVEAETPRAESTADKVGQLLLRAYCRIRHDEIPIHPPWESTLAEEIRVILEERWGCAPSSLRRTRLPVRGKS